MIAKVTVTKAWKSDNGELIFLQTPERLCMTGEDYMSKYMTAGSWFWAELKEPAQGKKAWKIVKDYGETEPTQEQVSATVETAGNGEFSGEERGMWYKEIGENYRAGKLEGATGKALMTAYWARMFTVVGLEKEKPKPPPPEPKELEPEDIPF